MKVYKILLSFSLLFNLTTLLLATIPKVEQYFTKNDLCKISNTLNIEHNYSGCHILEEAIKRFMLRLNMLHPVLLFPQFEICTISKMAIVISEGCDERESKLWPYYSMDESYTLNISQNTLYIESHEIWGTLHALETILQSLYKARHNQNVMFICRIEDSPRFPHRGMMIDTARHYLTIETIQNVIDALSMMKMNVLHWHMTDDEAFPYDSSVYPELSSGGAYYPHLFVYEKDEIESIIEYARIRGVRVMVEFDTPGHTLSWGASHPELLSGISHDGPLKPVGEEVWTFLSNLFREILSVFPHSFLHLGGNKYDRHSWQEDIEIQNFMEQNGFDQDYNKLENHYFEQLTGIIQNIAANSGGITPVVWQEVFENGFRGNANTVIHVANQSNWENLVKSITSTGGYRVINSACWQEIDNDFARNGEKLYNCDPTKFEGTDEETGLVIGGEALIWGTYIDDISLFIEAWPLTAVVAERLWSHNANDFGEFLKRLEEFRCRMRVFNWKVKPFTGPGFCSV
uniref:Beta-hexosaminidase n=1 Tax=Trichobilharzia regenti TaxID=157069 RepID=A0AA85KQF9_TRIRE|nr:unnamed protein product [Trichobilharzia regenti]